MLIVVVRRSPLLVRRNRQRDECWSTARRSRASVHASFAKVGWVGGMRAMGCDGMVVSVRLDFSEVGRNVWIMMELGIVPFFQSGETFVALNQG